MPSVRVESLGPANVDAVACLLEARNHTTAAYVHWKYGCAAAGRSGGAVVWVDARAVGCLGVIRRELELPNGTRAAAAWLADWYVAPEARGGVGPALLRAVLAGAPCLFGRPGTEMAQAIYRACGFRPLRFQSRRRIVLRPWRYEVGRTRNLVKVAARLAGDVYRRRREQLQVSWTEADDGTVGSRARFADAPTYCDWVLAQPIATGAVRQPGRWVGDGLEVIYTDDRTPAGTCRRLVLFTAGDRRAHPLAWQQFVDHADAAGCMQVELFTTLRELDRAWQVLGAKPVIEAPVLARSLPSGAEEVELHGWDREDFTFLAAEEHRVPPARVFVSAGEGVR